MAYCYDEITNVSESTNEKPLCNSCLGKDYCYCSAMKCTQYAPIEPIIKQGEY